MVRGGIIGVSQIHYSMKKHAGWLSQTDERILEFLREFGNHPPKAIRDKLNEAGEGMDYHAEHIGRECRQLADYGLVVNVGGGTYSITELGEQFLDGELDASTLDEDEE
jgi:repressor of nif and glnA expression